MRFKRRNVLYVPGVELVHGSPYAPSSMRQRHSRGAPAPRWCVPPEASCTSPSGNPKTLQGIHLHRGSMSFTNAPQQATQPGSGDVEDIETDPTHQVSLPESSPEQSYDLERDWSPHPKVSNRNTQHVNPPCRLEVPLPMALSEHPNLGAYIGRQPRVSEPPDYCN